MTTDFPRPNSFSFQLDKTKQHARSGSMMTPHGVIETPIFMPVGTAASVKALDARDVAELLAQVMLVNTYHLYLSPGLETLNRAGGVHLFMNWSKPVLSGSGGFQVFSLGLQNDRKGHSQLAKICEGGVEFTSHRDGSKHFFSPEKSIEIQRQIGADIIMAFDECAPDQASDKYQLQALARTKRWAKRCRDYWQEKERLSAYGQYQALFGIVQGAVNPELRRQATRDMLALKFDGIAYGGETVGYNMAATVQIADWVRELLPAELPRYAMGLGRDPENLVDAVWAGFDIFDCVAPTRLARNGAVYTGQLDTNQTQPKFRSSLPKGRLQIGNSTYKHDQRLIDADCDCFTCTQGYTRSYLHHLFKSRELSYFRLASIHNLRFMIRLTQQLREYIDR